jgi:citrate synthase
VFTALSGDVGALYGTLHGGAIEVNFIELPPG